MDLDSVQESIHTLLELDPDVPTSSEDDYTVRTRLSNKWVKSWENEDGVLWNELWAKGSITSTGASSYALSSFSMTNFKRPGGYVYDDKNNYWNVIELPEVHLMVPNTNSKYCYFLGDIANGYTLYFGSVYPASGRTIYVPYYKTATLFTTGSSKTEMSDPYYIIHGVVSDLLSTEDPTESNKNFQIAQNILKNMKIRNMQIPWYQDNSIPNRSASVGIRSFGQ